jgi:hypothetical protein
MSDQQPREALQKATLKANATRAQSAFVELTERLHDEYDVSRGFLVVCGSHSDQLIALSHVTDNKSRKLNLNLPKSMSLVQKVIESGQLYTENFCDAFTGNAFEQRLLLTAESRSFALYPLKDDATVVGLAAWSSETDEAFAMMEEGLLENEAAALAAIIAGKESPDQATP